MFVIVIKLKGALNMDQQIVGPYADYCDAEDAMLLLPAAIECDHKYIQPLVQSL